MANTLSLQLWIYLFIYLVWRNFQRKEKSVNLLVHLGFRLRAPAMFAEMRTINLSVLTLLPLSDKMRWVGFGRRQWERVCIIGRQHQESAVDVIYLLQTQDYEMPRCKNPWKSVHFKKKVKFSNCFQNGKERIGRQQ